MKTSFIVFQIYPKKQYNNAAKDYMEPTKYRFTEDYFAVEANTED